jgi:hypothetical protein
MLLIMASFTCLTSHIPLLAATTLPESAGWRGPKSCLLMQKRVYKEIDRLANLLDSDASP